MRENLESAAEPSARNICGADGNFNARKPNGEAFPLAGMNFAIKPKTSSYKQTP
jgi:hypothetical protein